MAASVSDNSKFPYSSENYGVYKPLIGWISRRTTHRFNVIRNSLAAFEAARMEQDKLVTKNVLQNGPHILKTDDLNDVVDLPSWVTGVTASKVGSSVQKFIKEKGRQPNSTQEWNNVIDNAKLNETFAKLSDIADTDKLSVEGNTVTGDANSRPDFASQTIDSLNVTVLHKSQLSNEEQAILNAVPIKGTDLVLVQGTKDAQINAAPVSQFSPIKESIISGMISRMTSVSTQAPNILSGGLLRTPAELRNAVLNTLMEESDLTNYKGVISPIGVLQLFREYFFEESSFLGPPVEHIWIGPGSTVELYEIHRRKTVEEKQIQSMLETTSTSESTTTQQDDISDAVKNENQQDTKLGISMSAGGGIGVYHADASANYSKEDLSKQSQETTHKQMRQQTQKLSSQIRRNFTTTFKTSVEVEDVSSRRHVINNPTNEPINYELRRKMRKVRVQIQRLGMRLCWQIFVDDPGIRLEISELVHVARPGDFNPGSIVPPAKVDYPGEQTSHLHVKFQWQPIGADITPDQYYVNGENHETIGESGTVVAKINYNQTFPLPPPPSSDLEIKDVYVGVNPEPDDPHYMLPDAPELKWKLGTGPSGQLDNTLTISLEKVNFQSQKNILLNVDVIYGMSETTKKNIDTTNALNTKNYTAQKNREQYEKYVTSVRDRIKMANKINPRPEEDLREEERTVIYRQLIGQLMDLGIKDSQTEHFMSEYIRSVFEVDSMLYYVSPEWWVARNHNYTQNFGQTNSQLAGLAGTVSMPLLSSPRHLDPKALALAAATSPAGSYISKEDRVGWNGNDPFASKRRKYMITEDSEPARFGSSLGWLLQLDGDSRRNAFLNSPWVKAVLPIRPGKESEAINLISQLDAKEGDLKDPNIQVDVTREDGSVVKVQLREAIEDLIGRVQSVNTSEIEDPSKSDQVFENGFDPLAKGFKSSTGDFNIFDNWLEILPTDQIVAVEYKIT